MHTPSFLPTPSQAAARTSSGQRCWLGAVAVASAHLVLIWALWALGAVRLVAAEQAPVLVSLIAEPAVAPARTPPPTPQQAAPPTQPAPVPAPPPVLPAPESPPAIAVPAAAAAPAPSAAPFTAAAEPAPLAAASSPLPAAPSAPPPPARKQLDASAVRYLVEPPAELPRASRRAGESGTVWLRVVVDAAGLPAAVRLHRSSGYPRLDEQALWAMRQARFKPHTEGDRAVEVEVIAAIEYPAE
jgi:periplasmic protein TonB